MPDPLPPQVRTSLNWFSWWTGKHPTPRVFPSSPLSCTPQNRVQAHSPKHRKATIYMKELTCNLCKSPDNWTLTVNLWLLLQQKPKVMEALKSQSLRAWGKKTEPKANLDFTVTLSPKTNPSKVKHQPLRTPRHMVSCWHFMNKWTKC